MSSDFWTLLDRCRKAFVRQLIVLTVAAFGGLVDWDGECKQVEQYNVTAILLPGSFLDTIGVEQNSIILTDIESFFLIDFSKADRKRMETIRMQSGVDMALARDTALFSDRFGIALPDVLAKIRLQSQQHGVAIALKTVPDGVDFEYGLPQLIPTNGSILVPIKLDDDAWQGVLWLSIYKAS